MRTIFDQRVTEAVAYVEANFVAGQRVSRPAGLSDIQWKRACDAAAQRRKRKSGPATQKLTTGSVVVQVTLSQDEYALFCRLRDADFDEPEKFAKGALLQGAKFRANRCKGKVKPGRA